MFSKILSICTSGDDWGHSLKIFVNYKDDYLKHHNFYVNKTMLFLSSERLSLSYKPHWTPIVINNSPAYIVPESGTNGFDIQF